MKKFIIINGKNVYIVKKENKEQVIIFAQNFMDQSSEIIVREFVNLSC